MEKFHEVEDLNFGGDHTYAKVSHNCECQKSISNLQRQLKKVREDVVYWRQKFHNLEKKYTELKELPSSDSKKAKLFRDTITKNRLELNGNFSSAQIAVMLRYNRKTNPNAFSKQWSHIDYLKAKQLHGIRGKSLDYVRKQCGLPLPSEKHCRMKFGFLKVERGYIKSALYYLKSLMPRLPMHQRLAAFKFDEM